MRRAIQKAAQDGEGIGARGERFGRVEGLWCQQMWRLGGRGAGGVSEQLLTADGLQSQAVFLGCKHAIPVMAAQAAAPVNVAFGLGHRWSGARRLAIAASKAGVIQFCASTAVQYAARASAVNSRSGPVS